jgi:S1 RNA binding domain protein
VNRAPQSAAAAPVSAEQSFEDKLKQFLSSSEGKMADLNRSIDGKRGGGRRRR